MTNRTYDALDRPAQVMYADGSTITYGWDAGDRLTQITDSQAGTITRAYDLLDRLTRGRPRRREQSAIPTTSPGGGRA